MGKKKFPTRVRAGFRAPFYFAWGCFRDFVRRTLEEYLRRIRDTSYRLVDLTPAHSALT